MTRYLEKNTHKLILSSHNLINREFLRQIKFTIQLFKSFYFTNYIGTYLAKQQLKAYSDENAIQRQLLLVQLFDSRVVSLTL